MSKAQTPGREANAAQPLGERKGLVSNKATKETGEKERRSAGPDGPDAGVIGATFKK
ncbi:MAG: hypothetical protein KAX56_14295 [Phenylobacterium sp.]|nr:hypothetical protein [Phenylobacterium sp.]